MDDKSKRRIRAVAKRLHWLMQLILFVFLVLGFWIGNETVPFTDDELHQAVSTKRLVSGSGSLIQTLIGDEMLMRANLLGYCAPENISDYDAWAAKIEEQLKQPVGIFLRSGEKVNWPRLPEYVKPAVAMAESLAMGTLTDTTVTFPKVVGSITTYSASFDRGDSTYLTIRAYDPYDGGSRWGVVLDLAGSWRSLIDALNAYRDHLIYDYRVSRLTMDFQLDEPSKWGTQKLGLQIFDNDSIVYSSPGLNAANESYSYDSRGPIQYKIFNSDEEQRWADVFTGKLREAMTGQITPMHWFSLARWLVFSFILALFYHWILKLTKPETNS
jgi:hypothetical protein